MAFPAWLSGAQQEGWDSYFKGDYQTSISLAETAIRDEPFVAEDWFILKAKAELQIGKYEDALATFETGLAKFEKEVGIRFIGIDVCNFNDDSFRAKKLQMEIEQLWISDSWRYRDPDELVIVGQNMLNGRADAKRVLTQFFDAAKNRNPNFPGVYLATGQLALQKHDFTLAIENFRKAVELEPANPESFYGLAVALAESDTSAAESALESALALNPKHADSLLLQTDYMINAEKYREAEETLDKVLAINPLHPTAWAYKATLAHLENQPVLEGEYRSKALDSWKRNPGVDHLIGQKLAQKYRFQESERYQRRSLVYDPFYLPAKIQLAHDLLRLGQELEGWKLADEVFDADQYSVVAHNLVTLRDNLAAFTTIESDGFVVRMASKEAEIYGDSVMDLLRDAKQKLTEKYQVELETPIFVEIFPQQQDFAIRTFGLPGGEGFLGVCFGRVVTMNSPAAQGAKLTNWQSVLWHEFCHVATLQKTNNRMPRWLSEGISVYEERIANPAWGQAFNPRYRKMILDGELTPLSQLSGAFLRPKSAAHLEFAYFESSLAVDFIVQEFGFNSLILILDDLSLGTPINDTLRRNTVPLDVLDKQFSKFVDDIVTNYATNADWTEPPGKNQPVSEWESWNLEHANNLSGLLTLALKQKAAGEFEKANTTAEQILTTFGDRESTATALQIKAANFRELKDVKQEIETLQKLVEADASNVEACLRGIELTAETSQWNLNRQFCLHLLAVNPLIKQPHRALAIAAEKTSNKPLLISSLRSLATMNPVDAADVHFRLAAALFEAGKQDEARKHVLLALDQAPRFRDAHSLLLKIVDKEKKLSVETNESSEDIRQTGRQEKP